MIIHLALHDMKAILGLATSCVILSVLFPLSACGQATTAQKWQEKPAGSASGTGMSKDVNGVPGAPAIAHRVADGSVYMAWAAQPTALGSSEIYVKRWNGVAWVALGSSATGGGISQTPDVDSQLPTITVRESDGHVFVAWQENDGVGHTGIYASEFDPGTSQWQRLGAGNGNVSNLPNLHSTEPSILLMPNNSYLPVVAWEQTEYNGGSSFQAIYVRRWSGLTWTEMGTGSASTYTNPRYGAPIRAGGINADDAVAIGGDHHVASLKPKLVAEPLGNMAVVFINGLMRDGNVEYLHGMHIRRFMGDYGSNAYDAWEEIGRSIGGDPLADEGLQARHLAVAGQATGLGLYIAADLNEVGSRDFQLRCYQWTGAGWTERGTAGLFSATSPLGTGQIPLFSPSLGLDSSGQLMMAWTQPLNGSSEIYLRRTAMGAGGQVLWQEFGTGSATGGGVSASAGLSGYPALTTFLQGGSNAYWLAWQDGASALNSVPQIYVRATGGIPAPEIVVEEPAGTDLPDGGSRDFGTVLSSAPVSRTFTVRNTGSANLTGLNISKNGTHAAQFTVTKSPTAPVVPGGSTTFIVRFAPVGDGARMAALHIASNDADENPFDINLTGEGVQAVLPVVKTLGSKDITSTTATVFGSVNPAGSARDVFFDYGTTLNYGTSVAGSPPSVNGMVTLPVDAVLTNLLPHTKYNFRIRATGALGAASGANLIFTTRNTAPTPDADTYEVLPGATVQLPVLTNDTDPDGDALSLVSYTALVPVTAGKLTRTGNIIIFTASAGFNGATFNHTVKDAFGGSAVATVTLTLGTCMIDPAMVTPTAAPVSYPIQVTASGAWSATESLTWVTVNPTSGTGDGVVNVTLQGNNSKTKRPGTINIGGQLHQIIQDRVYAPVLDMPGAIPQGIVGDDLELQIPTTNLPASYKVTNMPAGLAMNNATGVISGRPTLGRTYHLTISASNVAGTSNTLAFDIEIAPLSPDIIGTYIGYIDAWEEINGSVGSRIDLTTTSIAGVSGKITTGGTVQSFTGRLTTNAIDPTSATFNLALPRAGGTPLNLQLWLDGGTNTLLGSLEDDAMNMALITGWRNAWTTTNKATGYLTLHTFSLDPGTDPEAPQGYGYGSFTPLAAGTLTVAGRLPDNNTFTTAGFLGQNGEALIYQSLYSGKGAFGGTLNISLGPDPTGNQLTGLCSWLKPPTATSSTETVYRAGFGPAMVNAEGGAYPKLLPGQILLDLPDADDNASLGFTMGGLDTEGAEFDLTFTLMNPSPTGLTNKAIITTDLGLNPNRVTLPTLTTGTGAFSGQFILPGPTTALNRTVIFQGQIVNSASGMFGCGFFLMPELPEFGETLATSPKNSGRVLLQATPP